MFARAAPSVSAAAATDPMPDDVNAAFAADPYNKPEHIHTLKGRELWIFVIFYTVAVLFIVLMFEFFMPVLFNPNYPNDP